MIRTVQRVVALLALLAIAAGAQQPARTGSPGKYKYSGTIATGAEVSGWFEVDIKGLVWLSDGTCTPKRRGESSGGCTVGSVRIRRVMSAKLLKVDVEVLVRVPDDRGRIGGGPTVKRYRATMDARRV